MKTGLVVLAALVLCLCSVHGEFTLTSSAIDSTTTALGTLYTCFSSTPCTPDLEWSGAPSDTLSYAVGFYQTSEGTTTASHVFWFLYNIPADVTSLSANTSIGTIGLNDNLENAYYAPCAGGGGLRTFYITLYALSSSVPLSIDASSEQFTTFLSDYSSQILDSVTLTATFNKDWVSSSSLVHQDKEHGRYYDKENKAGDKEERGKYVKQDKDQATKHIYNKEQGNGKYNKEEDEGKGSKTKVKGVGKYNKEEGNGSVKGNNNVAGHYNKEDTVEGEGELTLTKQVTPRENFKAHAHARTQLDKDTKKWRPY